MANLNPNTSGLKKGRMKYLSPTERQQIAIKGAEASNKVYREKKKIKEQLEIGIDIITNRLKQEAKKTGNQQAYQVLDKAGAIVFEYMNIAFGKSSPEHKLRALKDISDRIEGRPVDKTAMTDAEGNTLPQVNLSITGVKLPKIEDKNS